jgi:hypothetical protein
VVGVGSVVSAQACSQIQATLLHCGGPNNCSQDVAVNEPYTSEYGFYLGYFNVACCSTYYASYTEAANCEGSNKVAHIPRDPLEEVASLQPLLIRNCAGGYDPYVEQPARNVDIMQPLKSRNGLGLN